MKKALLPFLFLGLASPLAYSASLDVFVELPAFQVAEYHAPYVAIWLQSSQNQVTNLALWYDVNMRNDKGLEWLKDLRQWWRRSGRSLSFPADGFTGATRAAGKYELNFDDSRFAFSQLPAGDYELYVEAVREVGGREILRLALSLPFTQSQTAEAVGENELGRVSFKVNL